MNIYYLSFCGNIMLKPSWYIKDNLTDSKKNDVLPEYRNSFGISKPYLYLLYSVSLIECLFWGPKETIQDDKVMIPVRTR